VRRKPVDHGDIAQRAEVVNTTFHDAYDGARAEASRQIPVLVVLGDDLILVRGGARSVTPCIPTLFHWTKAVAHAPVTVVAAHHRNRSPSLDEAASTTLTSLRASLSRLSASLEGGEVAATHGAVVENLSRIVGAITAQVESILASKRFDPESIGSFAGAVGPWLLRSTQDATTLQLRALHEAIPPILGTLDERDRAAMEVVVAGAHQARARNLPMQYFQKLFGEASGDERRVSYAENAQSVEDALAQVGTRRLDKEIARAFFRDERRLQRDILGDAAEEQQAVVAHAQEWLLRWKSLASARELSGQSLGHTIGEAFSLVRDRFADHLVRGELSYRGTLLAASSKAHRALRGDPRTCEQAAAVPKWPESSFAGRRLRRSTEGQHRVIVVPR